MKRLVVFVLLLLVHLFWAVHPAWAVDPPPVEKPDAQRILEAMEWSEVTILAIRQGVDSNGTAAPVCATVLGLGKLQGQHRKICQTLYYDRDLEWHVLELTDKGARLWTRSGYREIKPWATW